MAIDVFVLTPKQDQALSSILAFAKGLNARGICNGASIDGNTVKVYMLPKEAGRYKKWDFQRHPSPTYEQDYNAVKAAIVGGTFDWQMEADMLPVAEEPVVEPAPAPEPPVEEPAKEEPPVEPESEPAPVEPAAE